MENNNQTKSLYQKFKDFNASKTGKIFNGVFTVCLLSSFVLYKTGMIDKWQKQDTSPVYLSDVSSITASVLGHDVSDQDIAKLVLGKYPQLKQVDEEIIDIIIVMLRMDDSDFDAYSKIAIKNGYASKEDIDTYKVVRKDIHKVYPGIAGTITLEEVLAAELTVSIDMTEETEIVQHDKPKTLLEQEQELEEYVAEANKLLDKMGKIHLREHDINELRFKTSQEDRDRFIKGVIYRYPTVEEEAERQANNEREMAAIKARQEEARREKEEKERIRNTVPTDEEIRELLANNRYFNDLTIDEQQVAIAVARLSNDDVNILSREIFASPQFGRSFRENLTEFRVSNKRPLAEGTISLSEVNTLIDDLKIYTGRRGYRDGCSSDDDIGLLQKENEDIIIYNDLRDSDTFCDLSTKEKFVAMKTAKLSYEDKNSVMRNLVSNDVISVNTAEKLIDYHSEGLFSREPVDINKIIQEIKSF